MLSDLILYDVEKNEVTRIPGDTDELEVFPWWSPDGKYLYYASARFVRKDTVENLDNETILRYKEIKYNLFRRSFDPASRRIGPPELVFDAAARGKECHVAAHIARRTLPDVHARGIRRVPHLAQRRGPLPDGLTYTPSTSHDGNQL